MQTKTIYLLLYLVFLCSCSNDDKSTSEPISELKLENLTFLNSDIPMDFYTDLTFTNENTGYAISRLGKIIKTTNGGANWSTYALAGDVFLSKIEFINDNLGYVIGGNATDTYLYKTINAGQTWSVINLQNPEGGYPTGLYFKNKDEGYITGNKLFIKTVDGGQNWTNVLTESNENFKDVNFKDRNHGIVTTYTGSYYRTINGGQSWQAIDQSHDYSFTDIYFVSGKTLLKSGNSLVNVTTNVVTPLPTPVSKLQYISDAKCIGIGQHYDVGFFPYGDILLTNDNWANFFQKSYNPSSEVMDCTAIAKMNNHKTMILGTGQLNTKIITITY